MSSTTAVGLAILLLFGNAFFVAAEFALVSARRSQIEPRAEEGSAFARTTLRAMENMSLVIGVNQLGTPMWAIVSVMRPVIRVVNGMASAILRLFGVSLMDEVSSTYTREQVAAL